MIRLRGPCSTAGIITAGPGASAHVDGVAKVNQGPSVRIIISYGAPFDLWPSAHSSPALAGLRPCPLSTDARPGPGTWLSELALQRYLNLGNWDLVPCIEANLLQSPGPHPNQ